ncbi:MAG: hypothetical protein K0R50_4957 [Eubacterium sp.]|nr:hypothetical protein [Eubacterium sp.]
MPNMVELIKSAAMGAVNDSKPMSVLFGKVVSTSPLKIFVEQKLTLNEDQLILTNNVKDFDLEMTVEHITEESNLHTHHYKGKKKFRVHNSMVVGDEVIMLQMQGGQKFIVLDKVVNT